MTALKLDGRAAAAEIKEELRERVAALKERGHRARASPRCWSAPTPRRSCTSA